MRRYRSNFKFSYLFFVCQQFPDGDGGTVGLLDHYERDDQEQAPAGHFEMFSCFSVCFVRCWLNAGRPTNDCYSTLRSLLKTFLQGRTNGSGKVKEETRKGIRERS